MAASDRPDSTRSTAVPERTGWRSVLRDDLVLVVLGVTLLSLVVRFALLGDRIAHWDEGRVAYWIVHYQETGSFAYRRIIHGPFVQHVNRWLFPLVGANDFTMRLPVAVVGGLLPLSALLFRAHLRRVETVAVALFLAFNPVLLYYSRFMRSDLLVATFMFVSFGLLVRTYDTRRLRYLVGAAAFAALGFASKENAAIYVLTWLGATGLLLDQVLFRPREYDSGYDLLLDRGGAFYRRRVAPWVTASRRLGADVSARVGRRATGAAAGDDGDEGDATDGGRPTADGSAGQSESVPRDALRTVLSPLRYVGALALVAVVFLGVLLFFYAPRGAGMEGLLYPPADPSGGSVGFWQAFASPSAFVEMVDATWSHSSEEFGTWFGRATEGGDDGLAEVYVSFLGQYVQVMATKAAPLTAFAIFGFVLERYGAATSRNLVLFAGYCGFVSVLGYPLGTDIFGAWIVVHALVPLAIPAGVGLTRVFDWGYESFVAEDRVGVGIAAVLVLLVGAQVAAVAVPSVYTNDQADDNHLVQYAQPAGDPRAELETLAAAAREDREGADALLYYGETGAGYNGDLAFVEEDPANWDSSHLDLHPLCANWFNALPLPWYFAKDDADVECERDEGALADRIATNPPPVVITQDADATVPTEALESAYVGSSYELRTYGTDTTFWIRTDLVDGPTG